MVVLFIFFFFLKKRLRENLKVFRFARCRSDGHLSTFKERVNSGALTDIRVTYHPDSTGFT